MKALQYKTSRLSGNSLARYALFLSRLLHAMAVGLPVCLLLRQAGTDVYYAFYAGLSFAAIALLVFQVLGIYSNSFFTNNYRFKKTVLSWSAAFLALVILMQGVGQAQGLETMHYVIWFVVTLIALVGLRLLTLRVFRWLMRAGAYLHRSVIWGCTLSGCELARYLRQKQDIRSGLLGFVDDRIGRLDPVVEGIPVLGDTKELVSLIQGRKVDQVLVALPWAAAHRMEQIMAVLRSYSVEVLLVPDMSAFRYAGNRISEVGGMPMFNVSDFPLRGWSPVLKRAEDLVIGSIMLVALMPLLLLIALLVKLDSKGPVLFKQKRYGYNNVLIKVYKFRTMYHAERDMDASQQTVKGDARVTRIGRWLRRSSLDELPQLLNVLSGRMSLVGPRPHATATKAAGVLFENAVQNYAARHRVKPGITGWAQVNGYRGETDTLQKIEKRVEYDLEYIENWSILFDLYILLRTIPSVLFSKEAY